MEILEDLDKYPKSVKAYSEFYSEIFLGVGSSRTADTLYNFFDTNRIRCFVRYGEGTGKFKPEIWKAKDVSTGDGEWEMERVGFISCEFTRYEAEAAVFRKAFEILEEKLP